MRINKFVAQATGLGRRSADLAIKQGRVTQNQKQAYQGYSVAEGDIVCLDGQRLTIDRPTLTIMLNKPTGYVCSRNGQGSRTILDLLPPGLHNLKSIGRLDKDSSGLLLLTNDGDLANQLMHPRYSKTKIYEITLDKHLSSIHKQMINEHGIELDDGLSKLALQEQDNRGMNWLVTMNEGRNRQIRRTFESLGYTVSKLHRIQFGPYTLGNLEEAKYQTLHHKLS